MQDTARRKAASLALMTIMLAGGMTIAMPGEPPQAAAQTGTLSVSATGAFGGPQILEIVVDDPSRDGLDSGTPLPDVRIDDNRVVMAQSDTGKWYAYVASDELTLEVGDMLGLSDYIACRRGRVHRVWRLRRGVLLCRRRAVPERQGARRQQRRADRRL